MLKRLWLRVLLAFGWQPRRRARLSDNPFVLVLREEKDKWDLQDSAWLKSVLDAPAWQKLETFVQHEVVRQLMRRGVKDREKHDLQKVQWFVAGQLEMLDILYRHTGQANVRQVQALRERLVGGVTPIAGIEDEQDRGTAVFDENEER